MTAEAQVRAVPPRSTATVGLAVMVGAPVWVALAAMRVVAAGTAAWVEPAVLEVLVVRVGSPRKLGAPVTAALAETAQREVPEVMLA